MTAPPNIEARLSEDLKTYMRARDADTVACIRQLRSKVQESVNAKDFKGPVDDALHVRVIGSYVKSLEKGIQELLPAGERSAPLREKYATEIKFLKRYLPAMLTQDEVHKLVREAIAASGITDPKQGGKVLGLLMGQHRGRIDASVAKDLIDKELQG